MTIEINATHDPARRSWVESANQPDTDFPIQNLPFGLFRTGDHVRGGVALGDRIVDLAALLETGLLTGTAAEVAQAAAGRTLAPLLARAPTPARALRAELSELFPEGGRGVRAAQEGEPVPLAAAEQLRPLKPTALTPLWNSLHHIKRGGL